MNIFQSGKAIINKIRHLLYVTLLFVTELKNRAGFPLHTVVPSCQTAVISKEYIYITYFILVVPLFCIMY